MDANHFSPVPGAGDGVGGGRSPLRRRCDRRRNAGFVERSSFQRALRRLRPDRRRRHAPVGDADVRHATAHVGHMGRDRHDRCALRLDPRDLAIPERIGAGRSFEGDPERQGSGGAVATRQELLQRHVARAVAALHRNHCVERQQRRCEIAERRSSEEIAADRAHGAHRRTADRADNRMEIGELPFAQNCEKRDLGPQRHARAADPDLRQRPVRETHKRGDADVALVQRAHHQRPAGDIARAAVGGERGSGLRGRRASLHGHSHAVAAPIMRPRANACGSLRTRPDRSLRRPSGSGAARRQAGW